MYHIPSENGLQGRRARVGSLDSFAGGCIQKNYRITCGAKVRICWPLIGSIRRLVWWGLQVAVLMRQASHASLGLKPRLISAEHCLISNTETVEEASIARVGESVTIDQRLMIFQSSDQRHRRWWVARSRTSFASSTPATTQDVKV